MEFYRKVIGTVDDKTLDTLFKAGMNSNFSTLLSETKDIDMHTFDLLKAGLKSIKPSIMLAGVKSAPILSLRLFQQIF